MSIYLRQHAVEVNREALYKIFTAIKFLCRQGLALRGDGCENNSNFKILLLVLAEIDQNLNQWMKRKENVYTSPTIQNEIIKVMGVKLLRDLSHDLQRSPFLSIMVDETTDVSSREQATVVIRSVEGFEVHEQFTLCHPLTQTKLWE